MAGGAVWTARLFWLLPTTLGALMSDTEFCTMHATEHGWLACESGWNRSLTVPCNCGMKQPDPAAEFREPTATRLKRSSALGTPRRCDHCTAIAPGACEFDCPLHTLELWGSADEPCPVRWRPARADAADDALGPSELPGYTGWVRPLATRARAFRLARVDGYDPRTAQPPPARLTFWLEGPSGAALFARALGPGLEANFSSERANGSYAIELELRDPGAWHVEVIVEFSHAPRTSRRFPSDGGNSDPSYEGYPIRGSPFAIELPASEQPAAPLAVCNTSAQAAAYRGRWRLSRRAVVSSDDEVRTQRRLAPKEEPIAHAGRLDLRFEHVGAGCQLMDPRRLLNDCGDGSWRGGGASNWRPPHVVLLGDSTMRMQYLALHTWLLEQQLSGWRLSYVELLDGMAVNLARALATMRAVAADTDANTHRLVVHFNSGLHDIDKYCGNMGWAKAFRKSHGFALDTGDCVAEYGVRLGTLRDGVRALAPALAVFRTSTAGWPKWGNWGFAFNNAASAAQPYTSSPRFVSRFNAEAHRVMADSAAAAADVVVLDAFAPSLPRADHTQRTTLEIGKHMVHHGREVVVLQNLQLLHVILAELWPAELAACARSIERDCRARETRRPRS